MTRVALTTRQCANCRNVFTDDRLSAYCVTCQARNDEAFRVASNALASEMARICRARGDEAAARRIERERR